MNLRERLLFSWRWRPRLAISPFRGRANADHDPFSGYEIARDGLSPGFIALVAVGAIALGGFLGVRTATTHPAGATREVLSTAAPRVTTDAHTRDVLAQLSSARTEGRHDLARASSPITQAAAAQVLRSANLQAARSLDRRRGPVALALRRTATAYGALGQAALAADTAAFARASAEVERAERDLERLVGDSL